MSRILIAVLLLMGLAMPAQSVAVNPSEVLDDPALEQRARALSVKLRCLVCQNQSIDDSDAPLARDLRILVRERLVAGDSDSEALDFIVARYGEYVLLKPRFASHTYILWLSPLAILLAGAAIVWSRRKRTQHAAATTLLSRDEEEALKQVLDRRDNI